MARATSLKKRTMQASSAEPVGEPHSAPEPHGLRMILDLLGSAAIEALAHFLAGLEKRRQLLGYGNFVAGPRIAAGARLALFGRESAEAAQLHPLAAGEGVGNLAENGIDDILDVALVEMRIAGGHALHELR